MIRCRRLLHIIMRRICINSELDRHRCIRNFCFGRQSFCRGLKVAAEGTLHYITLHKIVFRVPKITRTARTLYEIKGVKWENI